jgi:hypothetical protein
METHKPITIRRRHGVNYVSLSAGWTADRIYAELDRQILLRESHVELQHRDAAARPRSFDPEAGTIEAVIASTTPVARRDARGSFREVLDPAGLDLASVRGVSVLDSHRQSGIDTVIGVVDDAWLDGTEVVARIRFSTRPEVAPLVQDVRDGVIRHLSVGYEVTTWADSAAGGERTRTATKWSIREASFVPVPADPACTTRTRGADPMDLDRMGRARQIRALGRQAGAPTATIDDLIDRGASVADARQALLFDLVARGRTEIRTSPHTTLDNPDTLVRAMAESLMVRVSPSFRPSGEARQFVGLSIPDLARELLRRAGYNTTAMSADAIITRALHTTSDFPNVLADFLGRTLREAYALAPSGIRQLARETTAADFRKKSRIMLDSSGMTLEKVNEHGEFKSGSMVDTAESYAIDSFGRIFGITRKALINDDLGAFTDLTRRLGQAAANFEAQFLVDLLTSAAGAGPTMSDGATLFHATHGNVATVAAAPSVDSLSAARLKLRRQTGPSGGLIAVPPRYLLLPPELETLGEQLMTELLATQVADVNPFSKLSLVIEPRLADAFRWYLTADPAVVDGLEFAYLAGAPGPMTETRAGFEVDGVQVKVRLDYGAGFVESRSWTTNAGH